VEVTIFFQMRFPPPTFKIRRGIGAPFSFLRPPRIASWGGRGPTAPPASTPLILRAFRNRICLLCTASNFRDMVQCYSFDISCAKYCDVYAENLNIICADILPPMVPMSLKFFVSLVCADIILYRIRMCRVYIELSRASLIIFISL
jgi:hypothetical protein